VTSLDGIHPLLNVSSDYPVQQGMVAIAGIRQLTRTCER
jgi:hypothetical protein